MSFKSRFQSFLIVFLLFAFSCTTSGPAGLFGKKSPHDACGDKIKNAGLNETAIGKMWFDMADQSLSSPLSIKLPYKETGYFPDNEVKATGLSFSAIRGEKITITLSKMPSAEFAIYIDLWQQPSAGETNPKLLSTADTASGTISYEVEKDARYILRLQPELLKGGEYTLIISTGPSLAFPVTPKAKSSIESFWGAGHDAGARKHEGIDILAARGTAAIAAANGVVTSVTTNKLGGKVVFLRPDCKDYTLYYAHLDKQLVHDGQSVNTGDTVGLIGNTGNAITTSPHIHFGVYTNSGAIDPLPFVNRTTKNPEKIIAPLSNLNKWVKNTKNAKLFLTPFRDPAEVKLLAANTLLKVDAATGTWYKVSLPAGNKGFIQESEVIPAVAPKRF